MKKNLSLKLGEGGGVGGMFYLSYENPVHIKSEWITIKKI
jgi:hypothetical protein